jgi:nitroreductase
MVLEAIKKRQSVRSYQDKEIPEEILQQILEAGRLAPSASNRQGWKFIVVKDENLRKKLVPACKNQKFVGEAPIVVAAASLGLGTCWIGAFYQDQVKEILGVPESVRVVNLLTLGYPKELGIKTGRKLLSEIICYNKFSS